MSKVQSFDKVLLDCIDEGLSILGDEPKQALYHYLATIHSLEREEIPSKVEEFSTGIRKALGGASKVIERLILKKLFLKMDSAFREVSNLEFIDYVTYAKRRFELGSTKHNDSSEALRSKKGQVTG